MNMLVTIKNMIMTIILIRISILNEQGGSHIDSRFVCICIENDDKIYIYVM